MDTASSQTQEKVHPVVNVAFRFDLIDPVTGRRVAAEAVAVMDLWSRGIVDQSLALAGDRQLVIETVRTYRSSDGGYSEDVLDWASHVLGCSRQTILRWAKNGPPPALRPKRSSRQAGVQEEAS